MQNWANSFFLQTAPHMGSHSKKWLKSPICSRLQLILNCFSNRPISYINNCSINKAGIIDFFSFLFCVVVRYVPGDISDFFLSFFLYERLLISLSWEMSVFFSSAILFSSFSQVCIHLCINNSETRRSWIICFSKYHTSE